MGNITFQDDRTVEAGEKDEAVRQLIRIGYNDLRGTLMGGFEAWGAGLWPVSRLPIMPAADFRVGGEK
jgi:hypothetical protein